MSRTGDLGYALHDGQDFLGHLARDEERLLPHRRIERIEKRAG